MNREADDVNIGLIYGCQSFKNENCRYITTNSYLGAFQMEQTCPRLKNDAMETCDQFFCPLLAIT